MRQLESTTGQTAVVIGGSMAGLLAARVLAASMERVILVERDRFPDGPTFRAGVPQSRHAHLLLERGRRVLDRLFPGFTTELLSAGAVPIDFPADVLWLSTAGWAERFHTGRRLLSASRELIEWTVRRRVTALPNVQVREHSDVVDLIAGANRNTVGGVRLRERGASAASGGAGSILPANLVVDASGRDSHAAPWLEALGYGRTEETRINAHVGYASRLYAPPVGIEIDWKMLFLQGTPPEGTRGAVLLPLEGGRWLVTLGGVNEDYPPTDEGGFLSWTQGLRSPILHEVLQTATPLSPVYGHRHMENRRRHFERLDRWPEGFVVMGDATCAFNPIYGQGMSVAANEALILDRGLRGKGQRRPSSDRSGLTQGIQHDITKAQETPWLMATGIDLRYPGTEGPHPNLVARLTNRYFDLVMEVATANPHVNAAFGDVTNLLASPASLFHPRVLLPVLRGGVHGPSQPPTTWKALSRREEEAARLTQE
ncbi:MAG: NAD(P)/FAD-dependent oxidoreductase [Dehalococcoidia bacterium]